MHNIYTDHHNRWENFPQNPKFSTKIFLIKNRDELSLFFFTYLSTEIVDNKKGSLAPFLNLKI